MKNKYSLIYIVLIALIISCFYGCASYSSAPSGGPMDVLAPVFVEATPKDGATLFNSKVVKLDFDEFIELKNAGDIYASPLLKNVYYNYNLKQVKIDIYDTLKPNLTYTIRFGNSLVDLHEANPLKDFSYTFSTGSNIDSMYLDGYIQDAYNLKPVDKAKLMFYSVQPDSFPITQLPDYVSVSNENGHFNVIHIKEGCYYVYAAIDENSDYLIDPVVEKMAYSDTCYNALKMSVDMYILDSIVVDTIGDIADSDVYFDSEVDSASGSEFKAAPDVYTELLDSRDTAVGTVISEKTETKISDDKINLALYRDFIPSRFYKDVVYKTKGNINIQFYYPIEKIDEIEIILPVDSLYDMPFNKELKWAEDRRSVDVYLQKSDIIDATVVLHINGFTDTVELFLPMMAREKNDSVALKLQSNAAQKFFLLDTLRITSSLPVYDIDSSRIELWNIRPIPKINDSAPSLDTVLQVFSIQVQDIWSWTVQTQIKEDEQYIIFFKDSSVFDFWGRANDTTLFNLTGGTMEGLGELGLKITNIDEGSSYRLQLLDQNDKVLKNIRVLDTGTIEFNYLNPSIYSFSLFKDDNDNGKWDDGDYVRRIQPEKRWLFSKKIRVEADWRVEETWFVK